MSTGHLNDWYGFCDVCGKRCFASHMHKETNNLIVCSHDKDRRSNPYVRPRVEKPPSGGRMPHASTLDSSPIFDYENDTVENISSYIYLATSQDNDILINDDFWISI